MVEQRLVRRPTTRYAGYSLAFGACLLAVWLVGWSELTHNRLTQDLEAQSTAYLDRTLTNAGAAFLIARSLNATISVLQSTTVGALIEVSIGEILDPINDLVERFSWVMLAVTVSVGLQKLLLEIGVNVDLIWFLSSVVVLFWVSVFLPVAKARRFRAIAYRLLILILLIRFAMPLAGLLGLQISDAFLDHKREVAMQNMEASQARIAEIKTADMVAAPKENLQDLENESQRIIQEIVNLITVFIFESILFPLLVLWGLVKLLGLLILPVRRTTTASP